MRYRTIAVHVNDSDHNAERVRIAADLALRNDAHLVGVAVTGLPAALYMPGMADEAVLLSAYLDTMNRQAADALAEFEGVADRAGVALFEKRVVEDDPGVALCLQARYSDLVVIGQDDPDESLLGQRADMPAYVVLNAGRPVLIVPYAGTFNSVGKRIVVAWDGGVQSSRAVSLAMPFLMQAEQVQVALFDAQAETPLDELPGADIGQYFARHGINVEVSRESAGDDIDIGNALLSHLSDFGADLLVMGGYGHSRFREILLGGVTRTVLQAMTAPVLMTH
ncbi:Nucleotide-binding universal stress protein, UspA family [Noviherbaspirillum humi]|uniref:Nucleotide-binding universal stress protein, UspA family n=1 Tax=Noviherbaspirillum humi TaxID=1688639 RepID=A0A239FD02_9BURK|nr:universal stress protein [Noviherbaspirillum humi]SNS54809.1 Nucleotide-binding universal stress protein, UspA family [Noviherbaspirillum humi]